MDKITESKNGPRTNSRNPAKKGGVTPIRDVSRPKPPPAPPEKK